MALNDSATVPRLQLLATAVLFSTGGAAIKASALSTWQVASFRSGIAALVLLVALPSARRFWTRRSLLVGLAYAATTILYVAANKLTTAANAIFLQSTAPLYLLLLEPTLNVVWAWLVHGEQPGPWSLAGCAVILLATVAYVAQRGRPSR